MRKCFLCLGLIGWLGIQNTASAAPFAASSMPVPQAGTIENVYYYHHHYYPYRYHGKYYSHRHYRHGHWHYY